MNAIYQAAKTRLAAPGAVPRPERVYEINKAEGAGYPCVVWSIGPERPFGYTLDARSGPRLWRITWQIFAKQMQALLDWSDAMDALFLDRRLDAPGFDCGPMSGIAVGSIHSALVRDPDDRGVIGLTTSLPFSVAPLPEEES